MLFYVEVTELGRLRNPRGVYPDTNAKLALIWLKNGNVLDETIISWTRKSPPAQGTNLKIFAINPQLYPSEMFGEYRNLQGAKQKAYEEAIQQAQKNFLAGKPYVEVNAANYKVTDQESVAIVIKYVKLLVALYID